MDIFQITALLIMAVFYGCYFAKMLSQKKQGIKTDHMGEGKTGFVLFVERWLKGISVLVPFTELASIVLKVSLLPTVCRAAGLALAAVGDVVFVLSVITMKDSWRAGVSPDEKTDLVTTGIYSISRNPAFLGFDLVYIGILMAFFNLTLCGVTLAGVVLFHLQIVNVEEDFLITTFGDDYLQYRRQVNRYLGRKK